MSTVGNIEKLPVSWPFGTFFGTALGWMVGRQEMHHPQSRKKCSFYRFCHLVVHRGHLSRQKETVYSLQLCCSIFVRRNDQMYVVHVLAIYCVLLLEGLLFTTKGGKNHATRIHCVFFCHPFEEVKRKSTWITSPKSRGVFNHPKQMKTPRLPWKSNHYIVFIGWLRNHHFFRFLSSYHHPQGSKSSSQNASWLPWP